jgi:hypothetical protein
MPAGHLSAKELYRGEGLDVFAEVDRGIEKAREALTLLGGMIRRNSWSSRSRGKFLELLPEGAAAKVLRASAA